MTAPTEYSGAGDPARLMKLLWRAEPDVAGPAEPARGPRPGLSVDAVVTAAIAIADADGLAALSMRRVAQSLGVGAMSLYTYVPGKAELLDVMVDTVTAEVAYDPEGPGWRPALTAHAQSLWRLYHRHPWLLQVAGGSRPVLGPHVIAGYERLLSAVDGIGLTDVEMDDVCTLLTGFVHGAARGSIETAQAPGSTGMTDQEWWEANQPLLERVFDPARFPLAARVGAAAGEAHQAAYDPDHAFAFGLARTLDGIEALVRSKEGS